MSRDLMKCCGMYCSCLLVVGIGFFLILIGLIHNENVFLLREKSEKDEKIDALVTAIIMNAVCLVGCIACTCYVRMTDKGEPVDDDEIELAKTH